MKKTTIYGLKIKRETPDGFYEVEYEGLATDEKLYVRFCYPDKTLLQLQDSTGANVTLTKYAGSMIDNPASVINETLPKLREEIEASKKWEEAETAKLTAKLAGYKIGSVTRIIKPYLVLHIVGYYPAGGFDDVVGEFYTLEEAQSFAREYLYKQNHFDLGDDSLTIVNVLLDTKGQK